MTEDSSAFEEIRMTLEMLRKYRDDKWNDLGDRPISPPAAFWGLDGALLRLDELELKLERAENFRKAFNEHTRGSR